MFSLELKVKGLERFRKLARNFPKAMIRLNSDTRNRIADILIDELKAQVRSHKKVVTGHLIDDIYKKTSKMNVTTVYFGRPRSAYAVYVDLGSKNKRPPNPMKVRIGYSIYHWVLYKSLTARQRRRINPKTNKPYGKPYIPSKQQLAYMIAWHVARERTKATHISRKAFRKTRRKIDRIIDEEVEKVLKIYGF